MVQSSGLQGYSTLMHTLGSDPIALLSRYRLSPKSLTGEDALLSLRAGVHLLEASARMTGCADFGLRLSQLQNMNVLGPLSIVLQNASTVRLAWDYVARHMFVHTPGLALDVRDDSALINGAAEMVVQIRLNHLPTQRQTIDLCLGNMHRTTQLLAGPSYHLLAVTLPHAPVAPIAIYREFFGAHVIAEQPRAALHLRRETLDASLQNTNPALRQITQDYLARHFRVPEENISARVRLALRRSLGTQRGNKTDVAQLLAIHPRTLQRHLAAERTSFEALREETRKEVALHYLRETHIALGQLADILGFSDQSAMTRSCRRWFGVPPSVLRSRDAMDDDPHT
ncbi:AraC family transcriptional regulator [Verminephrobacter aporrectodeae subsp. tuberculatae]|uniref:AraC family transcriptional regulator n=1 Tax=Verminephrobacter aporrectodeae subsp. tuberculatae TaxID=1110392 RepID=A0ABT3KVL8_9BURK|nr:AraC family transcriptional regulator [Verminephrobacter aporrectodeae]MCW5322383.1 AraC family transcriptional regulator [Verminephrobacter aporrectodeae subsp. tuberculatae]